MKNLILFILPLFLFTSCLKKIEEADQLNTNIFDRDYEGYIWFEIDEIYQYINTDGLTKIRVDGLIPRNRLPGLKPTFVTVSCDVNGQDFGIINAAQNIHGDYEVNLDATPDGSSSYCLTMGIYLEEDESVINSFTACADL